MRARKSAIVVLAKFHLALAIALMAVPAQLPAGEKFEFPVSAMPAELMIDADAVVRLYSHSFVVESPGKAIERVKRAVTVLNQSGRDYGATKVSYDKFRGLKSFEGYLLDAEGRKIRSLKSQEVKDYSDAQSYSLYEDDRARFGELYYDVYPYTVVFEHEINHNGLIGWPAWYPQAREVPVELATFELSVPADMPARYRIKGDIKEPTVRNEGLRKILRWEQKALPKREREPYGPTWSEQAPSVLTAPTAFEIAGVPGNMSSWESFGRWTQMLRESRTTLPAEALAQVQNLCNQAGTSRDKAKALYQYLQSSTRYVSVQLGIGGWQPFEPAYVFQRGYGDCKALSNYMVALLNAAQLPAQYALIRSGEDEPEVLADFPSNQFDHVVVCVPIEGDTLWLECTSQTMPFGHLGAGNEDRYSLLVTREGGKLVRTPCSRSVDNRQFRNATVTILETGDGHAEVRTIYTGNQQDRVRNNLTQCSPLDRENWLRRAIDVPNFSIKHADFSGVEGKHTEIVLPVSLDLPRYASRSGTRLFLKPNLMERWSNVPKAMENRTQPVEFDYAFLDLDSISYQLPPQLAIEAAFTPVDLETSFGSFHASAEQKDGVLIYSRRLEIHEKRLPPEQYEAYRSFVAAIVKADNAQVVLVRK